METRAFTLSKLISVMKVVWSCSAFGRQLEGEFPRGTLLDGQLLIVLTRIQSFPPFKIAIGEPRDCREAKSYLVPWDGAKTEAQSIIGFWQKHKGF